MPPCQNHILKVYKPSTKGMFWIMLAVYALVISTTLILVHIRVAPFEQNTFILGTIGFWLWCGGMAFIIRSQRIILYQDGHFELKVLGMTRTKFHSKNLLELNKEMMNGSPVYVVKYKNQPKWKPIPFLPFERFWADIINWMKMHNPELKINLSKPKYRHTYQKYQKINK